jgi:positive regulator of sigma E activity
MLFMGLLCVYVLPVILESVLMLLIKSSISGFAIFVIEMIGLILGFYILIQYFSKLNGKSKTPENLLIAGTSIIWIYTI